MAHVACRMMFLWDSALPKFGVGHWSDLDAGAGWGVLADLDEARGEQKVRRLLQQHEEEAERLWLLTIRLTTSY